MFRRSCSERHHTPGIVLAHVPVPTRQLCTHMWQSAARSAGQKDLSGFEAVDDARAGRGADLRRSRGEMPLQRWIERA